MESIKNAVKKIVINIRLNNVNNKSNEGLKKELEEKKSQYQKLETKVENLQSLKNQIKKN